ncbi:MAG: inositol monophosphatase family protein [Pirellulales bacterium]|nr:inositol monophosphatase family protein [Pirellulales bacterium]
MTTPDLATYAAFAERLADASRAIILEAVDRPRAVQIKPDASPVTETDCAVEERLRQMIGREYPDHGVMGEEFADRDLAAEWVWVLDPIDGTKAWIAGLPVYGTLIALARDGVPVLGVIDHPATGERWLGGRGLGARLNGQPIAVRSCGRLADALLCTSTPDHYKGADRAAYERLTGAVCWTSYGGSCYAHARLATGYLDLGFEAAHDPVDYCAIAPVVEAAGGVITDWEGAPLTIRSGRRFLAAGDRNIHAQALEILAGR